MTKAAPLLMPSALRLIVAGLMALLVAGSGQVGEASRQLHLVTFGTPDYIERFHDSLRAKLLYARMHKYDFTLFTESDLDDFDFMKKELRSKVVQIDCATFREIRWRGDQRYCKLAALQAIFAKASPQTEQFVFWHDIDTHIMQPRVPLNKFLSIAGRAPLVFTENALSLNNGAFFLGTFGWGAEFFRTWLDICKVGEWPWADNGCMLEVLLMTIGGSYYNQECASYSHAEYDPDKPFAAEAKGADLSKCYNRRMAALGHPCCGSDRQAGNISFLLGNNSFNHHECTNLLKSKDYADISRDTVKQFCYKDDGSFEFMVHSKAASWGEQSLALVKDVIKKAKARAKDKSDEKANVVAKDMSDEL